MLLKIIINLILKIEFYKYINIEAKNNRIIR